VARTSAFSFKGKDIDVRDIGRKLNVETVLEGSIQKAGNRVRITGQLVNVSDGYHLWSEKYDRNMEDIFDIQDEISEAIVNKLKVKLFGEEKQRLAKRQTVDLDVYNLYLKGRFFWARQAVENLEKARKYFEEVLEKDPGYGPAYAGLADIYIILPLYGVSAPGEVIPKAKEAVLKALEIDDNLAEAHNSLAWVKTLYEWDWEGGEREFRRSIELNPGHAPTHQRYALHLSFVGRFDEAVEQIEQALDLDPLSVIVNREFGQVCLFSGQVDRAIEALQKQMEIDPNFPFARLLLAEAYIQKGMYEDAVSEMERETEITGGHPLAKSSLGGVYARIGRTDEAQIILEELKQRTEQFGMPFQLGSLYMALGDFDRGFEWVERAVEERDPYLCWISMMSRWDIVRSDPRYLALLRRLNLDK
ncbi:MAG: tetratricopeptide repeat protein, partial [Candidatus Hydrogenedentota bacterium]